MTIQLRKAALCDSEQALAWRNHEKVRKQSFTKEIITPNVHHEWFTKSLTLAERCLLIAENNNQAIGVLRYDFNANKAELNIYLDPHLSGKGFGTAILLAGNKWIELHYPNINQLIAKIIASNQASIRAFQKAGFIFQDEYVAADSDYTIQTFVKRINS